jgi:hypothetical protein
MPDGNAPLAMLNEAAVARADLTVCKEYWRHRTSANAGAVPPLRKLIDDPPRRLLGAIP